MSEHLNRASGVARTLTSLLQDANREADAVQSLLLVPMIGRARALADDLRALECAITGERNVLIERGNSLTVMNLADTVERMRNEINADIAAGRVPVSVASFSELHDYVDANEYGGLCEDGTYAALCAFPRVEGDDPETMPASAVAFVNDAQGQIDAWLKAGRPGSEA